MKPKLEKQFGAAFMVSNQMSWQRKKLHAIKSNIF